MTVEDYINAKRFFDPLDEEETTPLILEDDALEAVDMAKREIAWKVHELISTGANRTSLDKYITDICDF